MNRLLLAVLLGATLPVRAAVDVTGAEVRAFLGGRTGKIAYIKNQLKQIYFLDLSDSLLTERKVSDDAYCESPMISPDGTRIVYESQAGIYVRFLQENSSQRFPIYSGIPTNGQSLEPHWWINSKTNEEYILFCTGNVADLTWPPKSGKTYMQKIVGNKPSGPLLTLLPFMMASGRSKNGVWGGTSHHSTGMYKLYADSVQDAFFSATNWQDSGGWGACNGSISPSDDPARQNRLMHLNSYLAPAGGEIFENHKAIVIRSYADKDINSPIWYMGIPGIHCNNDGSGNLFWDHSEWSTNEDFFTAVGSKEVENWAEADVYIGRINWTGENRILRILNGGGLNYHPHLWVKTGASPAKIMLERTAIDFVSLKKDPHDPRADTVGVANAGDGILPALQIGGLPGWLKVAILANGTNAPKLVNTVARAALDPGEYSATVKVSFGQGADSAAYHVRFKYSDPVLTSLRAWPRNAVLGRNDTLRYQALALDQTDAPLSPQPDIGWEALDSLPITPDGLIAADTLWHVRRAFRARAGAVVCTTYAVVAKSILRVDAGAAADSTAPGWFADTGSFAPAGGGVRETAPMNIPIAAGEDAAPAQVYRTLRRPSGDYRFAALPNGRYGVRLHFASVFPGAVSSSGKLDVTLGGVRILEGYQLPVRPDTGIATDMRELQTTVSDGKGLKLGFEGAAADVALAGLEVYDIGSLPIALATPNGGEVARIGDTLRIKWAADGYVTSVGIQISPDSGKSWIPVTRRSSVNQGQAGWGDYSWVIPDSLDGVSLASKVCMVSVYDYFGSDRDRSDQVFTILAGETRIATPPRSAPRFAARWLPGRIEVILPPGYTAASLIDPQGRSRALSRQSGSSAFVVGTEGMPKGVYFLRLSGARRSQAIPVPNLD